MAEFNGFSKELVQFFKKLEKKIPKQFYTNAISDYVFKHHKNMAPIHNWLKNALN